MFVVIQSGDEILMNEVSGFEEIEFMVEGLRSEFEDVSGFGS